MKLTNLGQSCFYLWIWTYTSKHVRVYTYVPMHICM